MSDQEAAGRIIQRATENLLRLGDEPVRMRLITAPELEEAAGGPLPGPEASPFGRDSAYGEVMRALALKGDRDGFLALACKLIEESGGSVWVADDDLTRRDGKLILEREGEGVRLRVERF